MTNLDSMDRALGRTSLNPVWWRIPAWAALAAITALSTHGLAHRVATGALMVGAALAFQFVGDHRVALRRTAVLAATVLGLAACLVAPSGLAEVPVLLAAGRSVRAFEATPLRWFVVLDTIAFAVTIGVITHHVAGLLAGMAVPLLVQRAREHEDLVRERDRAQALLAEVQAGREAETQAAALKERGRIAREMHDVLAHSLAGLSVQLQAIRAVAAREKAGPTILEPLDKAAALAREGLTEARAAVGALRDPVGLGIDALAALVERHPGRAALHALGEAGAVAPDAGHAVYRAVQEAMTNSARYAPGSAVTVTLRWQPASLAVEIADDGPAPGRVAIAGQGTGLGLAGMTERIAQAGGTLQSGPRGDGGWRTALTVPAAPASAGAGVGRAP